MIKMTFNFEFDEKGKTIRKQWLRCSLLVFILFPILISLSLTMFFLLTSIETDFWTKVAFVFIIRDLIFFAITYRFAYIKCGTRWLPWCLVIGPIGSMMKSLKCLLIKWKSVRRYLILLFTVGGMS
jgi:hypothetical protein